MFGALLAVSWPGLWGVVVGFALVGTGALVLAAGLVLLAASMVRVTLRAGGAGVAAAGALLGAAGLAVTHLADRARDGDLGDVGAFVAVPIVAALAFVVGRAVHRWLSGSMAREARHPPG